MKYGLYLVRSNDMKKENKKVNISDIPEDKTFEDYSDDIIFVFDDKPIKRDTKTGLVIRD